MSNKAKVFALTFILICLSIVIGLNIGNWYLLIPIGIVYFLLAIVLSKYIVDWLKPD